MATCGRARPLSTPRRRPDAAPGAGDDDLLTRSSRRPVIFTRILRLPQVFSDTPTVTEGYVDYTFDASVARPTRSGTTRSIPSRRRSTSGHQRPALRWASVSATTAGS